MSLVASFCAVLFAFLLRDVLDEIWDLIESVSEGFFYLLFIISYPIIPSFPRYSTDAVELRSCFSEVLRYRAKRLITDSP